MYQLSVSCGDLRNNPPQQFMKLAFCINVYILLYKNNRYEHIEYMSAAHQVKPLIFV